MLITADCPCRTCSVPPNSDSSRPCTGDYAASGSDTPGTAAGTWAGTGPRLGAPGVRHSYMFVGDIKAWIIIKRHE